VHAAWDCTRIVFVVFGFVELWWPLPVAALHSVSASAPPLLVQRRKLLQSPRA